MTPQERVAQMAGRRLAESREVRFPHVYEVVEAKKYTTRTYYVLQQIGEVSNPPNFSLAH